MKIMRNGLLLSCLAATLMTTSCGFQKKLQLQDTYSKITVVNDSLDKLTSQWHTLRDQASISKNYTALAPARIALGSFISRGRASVANIVVTPENEAVMNEEDQLLLNQSTLVAEVYPNFEQFNEYTPKETMDKNVSLITNDLMNVKEKVASIKKMLEKFAAKNNIKK
ncbi:hypothetical protein CJD36_013140 [Flavipsychrobacter stenotrophus]|uniref:LemA family protein n=2 Tax=Flavipsychrobacter stenotrophus TaxID=2077091 RepID=A0A2S7SVG1_9BACT|nr:hypothetical protein CJD36_013140 [Flavipsychrobacter stenotrophus]